MERSRGNWLLWAAAALLIGFAAVHLLRGRGSAVPPPVSVARAPSTAPHTAAEKLYVHVAGRGRRAGPAPPSAGEGAGNRVALPSGPGRRPAPAQGQPSPPLGG